MTSEHVMNALKAGREAYQEKLKNGLVEKANPKNPKERWEDNKNSLRCCIDAFCFECIGESIYEIKHCTAVDCPLYHVRPYQEKE
jgi:hypothetical protein